MEWDNVIRIHKKVNFPVSKISIRLQMHAGKKDYNHRRKNDALDQNYEHVHTFQQFISPTHHHSGL